MLTISPPTSPSAPAVAHTRPVTCKFKMKRSQCGGQVAEQSGEALRVVCVGHGGLGTAKEHMARVRAQLVGAIPEEEYAVAVSVLQRITDNLA